MPLSGASDWVVDIIRKFGSNKLFSMDPMTPDTQNFAKAEMLIRKPAEVVFNAIINPEVTTKFWFTGSSGRMDENKKIEWVWEMYQVSLLVIIQPIDPGKKIIMDWGRSGEMTRVEWSFKTKAITKLL
jgi:uncharacterized protein YndB with AHSA1/START domain